MAFAFEKLHVYQRAVDFVDRITYQTENFPRGYYFLANQRNRAALSIPANIAEGNGRHTPADRRNFFIIARGSIQECIPLIELARRRQIINETQYSEYRDQLEEIAKMMAGLIRFATGESN
ncbi:MAG: four helix bundle protein [Planctomycetota bacterium]|jgi:four helix bundle protein